VEKVKSVIAKRVIDFDYTETINEMIEDGVINSKQDINDNVAEWFADDARHCAEYNLKITIKS